MKLFRLVLCLLPVLIFLSAAQAQSPDNYPLPEGPPDEWQVPGCPEELVLEPKPEPTPEILSPAPQPGDLSTNRPSTPAGEAYEKYTGTRQFGAIGGTGITEFGIQNTR